MLAPPPPKPNRKTKLRLWPLLLQATCGEACPPCKDSCQLHCGHKPCNKPCSARCDVCTAPCRWSCPHHQCQLRCNQPCTRAPCNRPCNSILPCRHRCIGLCGELCVSLCAVCNGKVYFAYRLFYLRISSSSSSSASALSSHSCLTWPK